MERISTGSRPLDEILCGGFPRNSINIIAGEPGSGKTMLAQQLVFASQPSERPALYLTTLSEPVAKVLTYLQTTRFVDISRIGTDIIYQSLAEELKEHPEELPTRMLALLQEHRPRLVIIDSFKALTDLMPDVGTWRKAVFELTGLLSAYDTTTFLVGEYAAESSAEFIEFAVADGILQLRREQHGTRDDRHLRVGKLRGSDFRDGQHSFKITASGLDVYPRLVPPRDPVGTLPFGERLQTGVAKLDEMIESGWLRGTSTIVAGPSGAGKTMLGLHFLKQGAAAGEPGLLLGFQESPWQLRRMVQNLGWDAEVLLQPKMIDTIYTSPVELHIDSVIQELFRRISGQGVKRLVIDALGDLERNAHDPIRYTDYIYALNQHAAHAGVTLLLLLEIHNHARSELATGTISHMSDNTLLLGMEIDPRTKELERTIRIIKSRGSAHDGSRHVLRIGQGGLAVE